MAQPSAAPSRDLLRAVSNMMGLQVAVVVTGALWFGREVLIPLAFAVLLSFVLAPLVRILQKARVPRALAVLIVAIGAFAGIAVIGAVVASQVAGLAGELPSYERTIRAKLQSVRSLAAGHGTLDRAAELVETIGKEIELPRRTDSGLPSEVAGPADQRAVPVEVRGTEGGPLRTMLRFAEMLISPLATAGLIAIFVIFILMQREELRNRMIRLAGAHDLQRTTAAINDAARRLSRYFLVQLALNTGFGIVIGIGLWIIGVPSPALWAIIAAVLRFIPYIGAIIAALLPMALAAAVDPGWSMVLWTAALFAIVEPIVGHGIEPLVYGQSTGLSPLAVVLSAAFWTWIWGPIGLVMATPITACVVVLGRHVEHLQVFEVLLGDQPALSAPEVFYQRMLAKDPVEAVDQAEACMKDASLAEYLDTVALPGLLLAAQDELRGALDEERMTTVRDSVVEVVTELSDRETESVVKMDEATAALRPDILCIATRTVLDDAAGQLLALTARNEGLQARCLGPEMLSLANIFQIETAGTPVICLSMLEAPSTVHLRHALKRLRRRAPQATFVVGAWQPSGAKVSEDLKRAAAPATVVTSFAEAVELARKICAGTVEEAATPGAAPSLPEPAVAQRR